MKERNQVEAHKMPDLVLPEYYKMGYGRPSVITQEKSDYKKKKQVY